MKLFELFGEGFLADHVAVGDSLKAGEYGYEIRRGREITLNGHLGGDNPMRCLHRYNRFLTWLLLIYGETPCKSKSEAESFLDQKISAICIAHTPDFDSFWNWLRRVTLDESSML